MKKPKTQFGLSISADFENFTWTFEMTESFEVTSGEYAIMPKELFDELMENQPKEDSGQDRPADPLLIDVEMSVRLRNALWRNGFHPKEKRISDLTKLSPSDLMKFVSFGRKSLTELSDILEQFGYEKLV